MEFPQNNVFKSLVPYSDSDDDEEECCVGVRGLRKKTAAKKLENKCDKRILPNPCIRTKCTNDCLRVSENTRQNINEHYWGMSHIRREKWLLSCIRPKQIKKRRCMQRLKSAQRRNHTYEYSLVSNDEVYKVCQKFILKTLNVSQMVLRHLLKKQNSIEKQKKKKPHNKTQDQKITLVKDYIKRLPAVPSHYCRKTNSKLYIPQEFRNVSNLYKCYRQYMEADNLSDSIVSLRIFRHIFKSEFSIGFHVPKKDKCTVCENTKHLDKEERQNIVSSNNFQMHITNKNESKEIFLKEQAESKKRQNFLCASFDLQKVLNTPFSKNITLFYSRKYAYYNLSVYENGTRNGYCFLWGESDGKRGSNEICSALLKYLLILDNKGTTEDLSLYCDSCAGQNRNKAVLSMLAYFLNTSKYVKQIKITYLLSGHTMMPVDSIHSTIEFFIRNRNVWAPSEWPTLIRSSRTNPSGYECIELHHNDFQNWKKFADSIFLNKIKLNLSKLRIAILRKNPVAIELRYEYFENCESKVINLLNLNHNIEYLYHEKLKISTKKYLDLKNLCQKNSIPNKFHNEYLELKHTYTIKDTLAETDDED